jgi:hypothetical protein
VLSDLLLSAEPGRIPSLIAPTGKVVAPEKYRDPILQRALSSWRSLMLPKNV